MSSTSVLGAEPVRVRAGEGEWLHTPSESLQVKLGGEQTGGSMALGLVVTQPGGGPPLHLHRDEDELFIVQTGRIRLFANGAWSEAGPGSAVFLPRGEPHTYRNATEFPTSHWVVSTPSGFEEFFARWSALLSAPGEPDVNRMMALCDHHGIEILGPPPAL